MRASTSDSNMLAVNVSIDKPTSFTQILTADNMYCVNTHVYLTIAGSLAIYCSYIYCSFINVHILPIAGSLSMLTSIDGSR